VNSHSPNNPNTRTSVGPNATDKTIAHEVAGHGTGMVDVYDTATGQSNPGQPNNLMNNDNYESTGTKLNSQQVDALSSGAVAEGHPPNEVRQTNQPVSLWRRVLDGLGF
jgi:hypothetical protein